MDALPPNAQLYLPVLVQEIKANWPSLSVPHFLAGQVEQETCPSLKSAKCWNPKTENINPKNNGEYGWGLGQLTNTNRYNNFEEVTTRYSGLKTWKWEDRFNPEFQLRAMTLMDKSAFVTFKTDELNALWFAFSAYNGGRMSVLNDQKYCAQIAGCDPKQWFGHVEVNSLKARTKLSGYRVSAFDINREYVRNIRTRAVKYKPVVEQLIDGM